MFNIGVGGGGGGGGMVIFIDEDIISHVAL